MVRKWVCDCGWKVVRLKKEWVKDKDCPGGHAHMHQHQSPIPAKPTGKPGKHKKVK